MSAEERADGLPSLAPLVRQGLAGVAVPAGMNEHVGIGGREPAELAAQVEFVRRALTWVVNAHPEAVRAALAAADPEPPRVRWADDADDVNTPVSRVAIAADPEAQP